MRVKETQRRPCIAKEGAKHSPLKLRLEAPAPVAANASPLLTFVLLVHLLGTAALGQVLIFADAFESGDYYAWSGAVTGSADVTAPDLEITEPTAAVLFNENLTPVTVLFADDESGIAAASLRIFVDSFRLDPDCAVSSGSAECQSPFLDTGPHELSVSVWDQAGNRAQARHLFEVVIDTQPPVIAVLAPSDGAFLNTPSIQVSGTVMDSDQVAQVLVNGVEAVLSGDSFLSSASLVQGENLIRVDAVDRAGNSGARTVLVELDTVFPSLLLEEPGEGAWSNEASIRFSGVAEDEASPVSVTVAGVPAPLQGNTFEAQVPLVEGPNVVGVEATDGAGNTTRLEVLVRRLTIPEVTIASPPDGSLQSAESIDVSGTISEPSARVAVNGVEASVAGGSFTATGIPLHEGATVLSAVATLPSGAQATAKSTVYLDRQPPRLEIHEPRAGAVVFEPAVDILGSVNDVMAGVVSSGQVIVEVGGVPAAVSQGSFLLRSVALLPGANLLTVAAEDASGNTATTAVTVFRQAPEGPRIQVAGGNGQEAVIGTALALPLEARLLDESGASVAGETVVFSVLQGNGRLTDGQRRRAAETDSSGVARAGFTLGTRAGPGAHRVEATAAGFGGRAVFRVSGLPGPPALLHVDSGGQQTGTTGRLLPDPLVVVVTDTGFNPLPGVPVRFVVGQGLGTFPDGEGLLDVVTDPGGRARAAYRLGPEEGVANEVVVASLPSSPEALPVTFVASARAAGDPAETTVTGLVLDNSNRPVPGVTMHVSGTTLTTQTDEEGFFEIAAAPVGSVHLEADGSTTSRPGVWPHLGFDLTTVPGRENGFGRPIHLLPLDVERGLPVSETEGGVLTVPELPGFSLEVAPGSVTFPDGGRSGMVSMTLVHGDKVPMVPNFGQQPNLIFSLQPTGALFDPPARLTLPNTDGLEPGEVTDLYSFDHAFGRFVSIGTGSVSDDGALIVSDPGVGILEAAWHCGGNPARTGTAHDCPQCQRCTGSACVADDSRTCELGDRCKVNDRCSDGACIGDDRRVVSVEALANGVRFAEAIVGDSILFEAQVQQENCPQNLINYSWNLGDGTTGAGATLQHVYRSPGIKSHRVTADCDSGCSEGTGFGSVRVECPEVVITGKEHELALCPDCAVDVYAETTPPGQPVEWFIPPGQDLGGQVTVAGVGLTGVVGVDDPAEGGTVPIVVELQEFEPACASVSRSETSVFVFVPDPEPLVNLGKWKVRRGEIRAALKAFDPECLLNLIVAPAIVDDIADQFFIREDGHAECSATDNTPRNAFVHGWLNCYTAAHCGRAVAKEFWDGHENYPDADCEAAAVDFHNNSKGRDVAIFQDPFLCSGNVLQALFDGELQWKSDPDDNVTCPDEVAEDMFNPDDPCYIGSAP